MSLLVYIRARKTSMCTVQKCFCKIGWNFINFIGWSIFSIISSIVHQWHEQKFYNFTILQFTFRAYLNLHLHFTFYILHLHFTFQIADPEVWQTNKETRQLSLLTFTFTFYILHLNLHFTFTFNIYIVHLHLHFTFYNLYLDKWASSMSLLVYIRVRKMSMCTIVNYRT